MQGQISTKARVLITGVVTLFIFGGLLWEHFHGGVPSHHILQQKELPAISNWWNGLFLPILAWILLGRIDWRLSKLASSSQQAHGLKIKAFAIFILGLTFAILISVSFVNDYKFVLDNVPYALLVTSLIVPIFYSEFILGFIIGMTLTFGAILPAAFISIIAALGFIVYRFVRPILLKSVSIVRNQTVKNTSR